MATTIAVEGLIGAGKTTLCRLLERERGARLVLEPSETNPFLEPFYRDPVRFAFPAQMAYLIQRWRQQQSLRQLDLFDGWIATDYVFQKDRLFAEKTLADDELALYDRFLEALEERGPRPDLLVWLHVSTATSLARIAHRQAPGEETITPDYLDDLRARYETLLAEWRACPVLVLDTNDLDVASDPAAQAQVLDRIDRALAGEDTSDPIGDGPWLFDPARGG